MFLDTVPLPPAPTGLPNSLTQYLLYWVWCAPAQPRGMVLKCCPRLLATGQSQLCPASPNLPWPASLFLPLERGWWLVHPCVHSTRSGWSGRGGGCGVGNEHLLKEGSRSTFLEVPNPFLLGSPLPARGLQDLPDPRSQVVEQLLLSSFTKPRFYRARGGGEDLEQSLRTVREALPTGRRFLAKEG